MPFHCMKHQYCVLQHAYLLKSCICLIDSYPRTDAQLIDHHQPIHAYTHTHTHSCVDTWHIHMHIKNLCLVGMLHATHTHAHTWCVTHTHSVIHTYIHTHTHTQCDTWCGNTRSTYTHMHTCCVDGHTFTYTHTHNTHTHTHTHTYTHTYTYTHTRIHIHTRTHKTHTHTYMFIHTHRDIHTQAHIGLCNYPWTSPYEPISPYWPYLLHFWSYKADLGLKMLCGVRGTLWWPQGEEILLFDLSGLWRSP